VALLKAAVKMIEEGWKFVHTVADDNGVSAQTDRAEAGFQIALADFETAIEKKYRVSVETIKKRPPGGSGLLSM